MAPLQVDPPSYLNFHHPVGRCPRCERWWAGNNRSATPRGIRALIIIASGVLVSASGVVHFVKARREQP